MSEEQKVTTTQDKQITIKLSDIHLDVLKQVMVPMSKDFDYIAITGINQQVASRIVFWEGLKSLKQKYGLE